MDIYSLLDKRFICSFCGREHYIPIKRIITKKGAISLLSSFLLDLVKGRRVLILSDNITYDVAGKRCEENLKGEYEVTSVILKPESGKRVHAEEKYLPQIFKNAKNQDVLIAVGTGSITDMGKYVSNELKIPLISFPTAPSMNGFTSGVAALLMRGLKITIPVKPALGILIDTRIISSAPLELIKSGFADSLAKSFANTDWKISSMISGDFFCPLPLKITTQAEEKYINKAEELLQRNEKVISYLMEGLSAGGFSIILAGKSSPASGGEHLISHFFDIEANKRKREPFSYHGLQVGLGIIISSTIYERLKGLSSREVERRLRNKKIDYDEEIKSFGKDAPLIKKEFSKKVSILKELPKKLPSLWNEIKEKAFPLVHSSQKIRDSLKKTGCPLCFKEMGVDKSLAYKAIMTSRYIRGRLTILDIASELGILREIAEEFS